MLWEASSVLLLVAVARAATGPSVTVGAVDYQPISVFEPSEIHNKWWFWLIIGFIGLFLIVAFYFVWRGVKQWRLHKQREQQEEEREAEVERDKDASPAGPASAADGSNGQGAQQQQQQQDIELGRVGNVTLPLVAEAGDQPLTAEQRWAALQRDPAWQAERERRTAVHPGRYKW